MTGASRGSVEVDTRTAARQKCRVAATWPAGVGLAALIGQPSGGRSNLAGALGFDANVVGGACVAAQRASSIGPCTNRPCRLAQRCLTCAARRPRCRWRTITRAHHVTHMLSEEESTIESGAERGSSCRRPYQRHWFFIHYYCHFCLLLLLPLPVASPILALGLMCCAALRTTFLTRRRNRPYEGGYTLRVPLRLGFDLLVRDFGRLRALQP
jgi:hypothetical protein